MNYRSVADLARTVRENLHRVPGDVDLVVGIPRSGLLAANLVALGLNVKLTDVVGLVTNARLHPDNLRASRYPQLELPHQAKHVLLVDDSILTGGSMAAVRSNLGMVKGLPPITSCAVYCTEQSRSLVDVAFESVAVPRAFEWNLMHRELISECCVDIDGVLCEDPSDEQNDDGARYLDFMDQVRLGFTPTHPIGHLVTARLEKYRGSTEQWLERNGVRFGTLHMLDLPDAATRRRLGAHASFKAAVYRSAVGAALFIESDPRQAMEIARLSGKPVLCHRTQEMILPGPSIQLARQRGRNMASRIARAVRRLW